MEGTIDSNWQRIVGRAVAFIMPVGRTLNPATLSALDANSNEVIQHETRTWI